MLLAALVVLGAAAGPARPAAAEDSAAEHPAAALADRVTKALRSDEYAKAVVWLDERGAVDLIASHPPAALALARTVLLHASLMNLVNPEAAARICARTLEAARKAASGEGPAQPGAAALSSGARAAVYARVADSITAALAGRAVSAAAWAEAFAPLRAPGLDPDRNFVEILLCVSPVLSALGENGPDEAALRAAADLAALAAKARPDDPDARELLARARLELACGLASTKPPEAKAMLPAALAAFDALGLDLEKDEVLMGLWNRATAEALRRGVAGPHKMRCETVASPWKWFEMEIPKASGWTLEPPEEGEKGIVFTLQRDRGRRSQASVTVYYYFWTVNYLDDADREVGGENRGGLLRRHRKDALELFAKVTKDAKSLKGPLSKRIPETMGFELRGKTDEGRDLRVRSWYFHGQRPQHTFRVELMQLGSVKEGDAQLEIVLESLRELPAR